VWFVGALLFDGAGAPRPDQAFQVRDGRVTWVGDRDEAPPPGRQEEVVDLAGACVLPGLLDVHTHPAFMSGLVDSVICLPPQVGSIDDLVAALSAGPAVGGDESRWVEGFGFDESGYPEGRQPNRHDLDRVTADQPVFVRRCDGHPRSRTPSRCGWRGCPRAPRTLRGRRSVVKPTAPRTAG
jgi:predicted amidohydrolase YtcJ